MLFRSIADGSTGPRGAGAGADGGWVWGFVRSPWPEKGERSFPRESSPDVGFAPSFGGLTASTKEWNSFSGRLPTVGFDINVSDGQAKERLWGMKNV